MQKLHTDIQLISLLAASGTIRGGVPAIVVWANRRVATGSKNLQKCFNTLLTLLYKTAVRSSLFAFKVGNSLKLVYTGKKYDVRNRPEQKVQAPPKTPICRL